MTWEKLMTLLLELGEHEFAVFSATGDDEAAAVIDRLIEIAIEQAGS